MVVHLFPVPVTRCRRLLARMSRPRYRRPSAHSSVCSARTAPTRRMIALRLGNMPTESVRRRISRLRRSFGLFDQIYFQSPSGNSVNARMSALAASRCLNASASLPST